MPPDDTSLSRLLVMYWWPFWLFEDASRGDMYARAAAYRHNRQKRVHLPGYLLKWSFLCALVFALMSGFDRLAARIEPMREVFTWLCAGSGLAFSVSLCLLLETAYIYLYLSRNDA